MKLDEMIESKWLDADSLRATYSTGHPYPHIVMNNFINPDLLSKVENAFPDLRASQEKTEYGNTREKKLASKGLSLFDGAALELNSYLQSDLFLKWLNALTGIEEPLISDPYMDGGGYHQIERGGFLKVHADFNKHSLLNLDRRLNLLIYLNKNWSPDWGGGLQLYDNKMQLAREVMPAFNTAVIFSTTSFTYHGHPSPLECPAGRSRRSIAYYYYSTGRPRSEVAGLDHGTLFRAREGENFGIKHTIKEVLKGVTPPILLRLINKERSRKGRA